MVVTSFSIFGNVAKNLQSCHFLLFFKNIFLPPRDLLGPKSCVCYFIYDFFKLKFYNFFFFMKRSKISSLLFFSPPFCFKHEPQIRCSPKIRSSLSRNQLFGISQIKDFWPPRLKIQSDLLSIK